MSKLLTVGRKLAVLGVDMDDHGKPWHVVRPGSFTSALGSDYGKTIGRSMCGRFVITNGYASDFAPKGTGLCPACAELT